MTVSTPCPEHPGHAAGTAPSRQQKQHRVLVTGSRKWTDRAQVEQALDAVLALLQVPFTMQHTLILVHGAATGLDTLAARSAAQRGWTVEGHPAQWDTHTAACPPRHHGETICKMAGHRRNHEMIALGADLVVSFPTGAQDSGESKGTWGCTSAAVKVGLPTVVLWNGFFHPWGERAGELIKAERTITEQDSARHIASPARLETLRPIPF